MLFEMFLFGLYVALFGSCLHILLRNRRSLQKSILAAIVLMFLFAMADIVWGIVNMHHFILAGKIDADDMDAEAHQGQAEIPIKILQCKFLLYITSNVIADTLLIYRCYTLWNRSRRIIILPCSVLLGGTICGYLFVGMADEEYTSRDLLQAFLFATLSINLLMTSLIAGRIWWIARKTRTIIGPKLTKKYRTSIAIFIESGLVYSIYVILDVVLHCLLLDAGLVQIVGLVPTLMIVQIGMSQTNNNNQTTIGVTTNNVTTHKEESSATTSLAIEDPQRFSSYMYGDPETQNPHPIHGHHGAAVAASPIVIPAPPYRMDAVERFRMGYPASPGSDDTRVGTFS